MPMDESESKKSEQFQNSKQSKNDPVEYRTAGEYAEALRTWMNQVYQLQCVHAFFPYFFANLQAQATSNQSGGISNNIFNANIGTAPTAQVPPREEQQRRQDFHRTGIQFVIPPIWKRFLAEAFDFFLLFVIKLAVTYAAVDAFDLLEEVDKYDFETLGTDFLADYRLALSMTSEILFLELIHRIGTCVFEALCLHRGAGGVGGATPGKRMMGLRVVRCEWVAPTLENRVVVYPATDLGFGRAMLRSVIKNFMLTFLFPVFFTLFSFQYRRTVYDVFAGSIVVEAGIFNRQVVIINNNNNNNNNNVINNNNVRN